MKIEKLPREALCVCASCQKYEHTDQRYEMLRRLTVTKNNITAKIYGAKWIGAELVRDMCGVHSTHGEERDKVGKEQRQK